MNYLLLYFQQFHSVFMQHMTIVSFKFKQEVKQSLTTELAILCIKATTFTAHMKKSLDLMQSPATCLTVEHNGFSFKSSHFKCSSWAKLNGSFTSWLVDKSRDFRHFKLPKLSGSSTSWFLLRFSLVMWNNKEMAAGSMDSKFSDKLTDSTFSPSSAISWNVELL